jgi:hypothetical protein
MMDRVTYETECQVVGHAPADVEHLKGHYTKLTCPRCKKSVIEHGLSDHPDAQKKGQTNGAA